MRNMIALRKLFAVFGRGSIEFLDPSNRKVLAYIRKYGEEQVLCVANLSRFAQPVDLDLSKLEGTTPVEMLGYVEFPRIGQQPYRLTMAPYSFLWLELQPRIEPVPTSAELAGQAPLNATRGWESVFEGVSRERLETLNLPAFLPKQRWFAGKTRQITGTRVVDWAILTVSGSALAFVEVQFDSGAPEIYFLPLAMTLGETSEELRRTSPNAVIAPVVSEKIPGLLHDGVFDDKTCLELLSIIGSGIDIQVQHGRLRGVPSEVFSKAAGADHKALQVHRGSAEQSNTSILYGDRLILKLFRRQEPGVNPDAEAGRYLTEHTSFTQIPPFAGSIELQPVADGEPGTVAMLQGLVLNEGDGWKWTVEELNRYLEACAPLPVPENLGAELGDPLELSERPASHLARNHIGIYLDSAATLGRRTAELHLALAAPTDDPAFAPEPLTADDIHVLIQDLRERASGVFEMLKEQVSQLPDKTFEIAISILSWRRRIFDIFGAFNSNNMRAKKIRIHGDYHLGQVLLVKTDFVILDFEGEPAQSLAYRRSKQCPLKDVAGMLRSFSYAAYTSLINYTARHPDDVARLEPWAHLWERAVGAEFLRAYRETALGAEFLPADGADFRKLLDIFLLDKAFYEVRYELNSRPAWVRIPLRGIMSLVG